MAPPVGVKGPTVPGDEGTLRARPEAGTGLGMGALMSSSPDETVAGSAPMASILTTASPDDRRVAEGGGGGDDRDGRLRFVWKSGAVELCPTAEACPGSTPWW